MEEFQKQCTRANDLLDSLSGERERWETTERGFDVLLSTLMGNALMGAGFLTSSRGQMP